MAVTYGVNRSGNAYNGQTYAIIKAPGGVYHVYNDGRKVFMPAAAPKPAAKPSPKPPARPAAPRPPAAAPRPPAAGQQAGQPAGSSNDPNAGTLNPDSEYFTNVAQDTFDRQSKIGEYDAQDEADRANYVEAIRRLQAQRPNDERTSKESANNSGLLYSGALNRQLNDIAVNYARQQADREADLQNNLGSRERARQALRQGGTLEQASQLAAAADRQIARDADAAASNSLVVNAPPPIKPVVAKPAGSKPKPASVTVRRTPAQMRAANPAMVARVKRRMLQQRKR